MSLALFLALLGVLWLLIEVFSILLKLTGLELSKSRFQVVSMLTHTGFTTRESELIVQHPVRRRIAGILMIISYVAQVTLITLLFDLLARSERNLVITIAIISAALLVIVLVSRNKFIVSRFDWLAEKLLSHPMKAGEGARIERILNLSPDFNIYEFIVEDGSPLVGRTLRQARLKDLYIQVLKIDRGSEVLDFPLADTLIQQGDRMVVYGRISSIARVNRREADPSA